MPDLIFKDYAQLGFDLMNLAAPFLANSGGFEYIPVPLSFF